MVHTCIDMRFSVCQCRTCTRSCSCVSTVRLMMNDTCPMTGCADYRPAAHGVEVPPPTQRLPKAETNTEQLTLFPYK